MTTDASEVPLNRLRFDPSINARGAGPDPAIGQLVASIAAHGLLLPLVVRLVDRSGAYRVVAGSRRLTALNILAERGMINADRPIPVMICDSDDDEAREISLAENVIREPMHPVDQYEAFSRLADAGKTPIEIAARFGYSERLVRQRIALGALHPDIRAAWRAGTLSADAAQAFTLARDPMHQKQVYLKLESANDLFGDRIRAALGAYHDVGAALKFVGSEAYREAGGEVIEDLFGDNTAISDPDLVKHLAAKRIDAECSRLVDEEGWSFAEARTKKHWSWQKSEPTAKSHATPEQAARQAQLEALIKMVLDEDGDARDEQDIPPETRVKIEAAWEEFEPPIRHSGIDDMQALDDEAIAIATEIARGGFSARQKKKAGCLVDLTEQGALQITYGALRPVDPKAAPDHAKNKKGQDPEADAGEASEGGGAKGDAREPEAAAPPEPEISATLRLALTEQRTLAAAAVMRGDTHLALRAIVAAFETRFGSPVKVVSHGHASTERDDAEDIGSDGSNAEFGARLRRLIRLPEVEVLHRLASIAACAIDMRTNNPAGADALIAALDAEEFRREALEAFDPSGYFKGVNAELCNRALDEMALPAKPRPKKKSDLAEFCITQAKAHRWLPPELRHPRDTKKPSLAEAMQNAIKADEDTEAAE